jgi:hypothetical protein
MEMVVSVGLPQLLWWRHGDDGNHSGSVTAVMCLELLLDCNCVCVYGVEQLKSKL